MRLRYLLAALVLAAPLAASAQLSLPQYFASGAVLQRETAIPVWGEAGASADVAVTLNGVTQTTQADASGDWRLELPAMSAGGPYTLTVTSGSSTRTLTDVYVGDVWLASGQSNMEWTLGNTVNGPAAAAAANDPALRQFKVPKGLADEPSDALPSGSQWTAATSTAAASDFSAVAYYFARDLREELDVPIGILNVTYGGSRIETWMPDALLGFDEQTVTLANGEPERQPTVAYNKMVHPLLDVPITGVVWYQGESNGDSMEDALAYGDLFQTFITGWRGLFGQGDLPFIWVQLPNYGDPQTVVQGAPPTWDAWPQVRAGQSSALALPNTGEVVAIDTGNEIGGTVDIHPTLKEPVGERMALVALDLVYDYDLVSSGPRYASNELREDGSVAVSFDAVDGGLVNTDGTLNGFTLAGPSGTFVWADARIEGDQVIVSSDAVAEPVRVQYAWQYNPGSAGTPGAADLYNAAGLPTAPFSAAVNPGFSIASFSAARPTIEAGQSTVLSWTVFDAASVTLDGEAVELEGSLTVSPTETTTYTLVAVSADDAGQTLTAEVTVEVLDPSLINRAEEQPARSSTYETCCGEDRTAALAVDGDLETRWASAWSDGTGDTAGDPNYDGTPDDEWIDVDLGGVFDLDRVILTWEAAYATAYELQTSFDGANWTTVYTEENGDGGTDDVTFEMSVPARFLRMQGVERTEIDGQQYGYSLYELAAYGEASAIVPPSVAVGTGVGNVIAAGAVVTLTADASDDGTVEQVAFYADGAELATDTEAPFETSWTAPASGSVEVTAVATDDDGYVVQSAPFVVYVDGGTLTRFEAEDATTTGTETNVIEMPSDAASGGAYLELRDGWTVTFPEFEVEEAGDYLVSVGYQLTFESPKTQFLVVNGDSTEVAFTAPSTTAWMQKGVEVPLVAGTNEIAIHGSWNWMSIDFIAVEGVQTGTTLAGEPGAEARVALGQNRPNPFRDASSIQYTLPAAEHVRLEVFDLTGRRVLTLVDAPMAAGTHTVGVEAGALAGGVYVYQLRTESEVQARQMVVVR